MLQQLLGPILINVFRKLSSRKCKIVKELANPEIVQMPFVTESFKISLIIPVQEKDSQKVSFKMMTLFG